LKFPFLASGELSYINTTRLTFFIGQLTQPKQTISWCFT